MTLLDPDGAVLLSRKVANDEREIVQVIADCAAAARHVQWAVDLTTVEAALLLSVLWANEQPVRYLSGRIADQSRMRRDLPVLRPGDDLIAELRKLTRRRADLVAGRTQTINRLRQQLTAVCGALERAADIASHRGWAILLARYQRPKAIRRAGVDRLTALLADAGVRNAATIAEAGVTAAKSQTVRLPGEDMAAEMVAALAKEVMDLDTRIKQADTAIEDRFRRHHLADVIVSTPGFGYRLGAELLAAIGDLDLISSADHLAAYAGLAPVANDSGKLHPPSRYNRRLRRAMYMSAVTSMRCHPESRAYYDRAEGKRPIQAVICLARRRTNVLWALIRDNRTWQDEPPAITA